MPLLLLMLLILPLPLLLRGVNRSCLGMIHCVWSTRGSFTAAILAVGLRCMVSDAAREEMARRPREDRTKLTKRFIRLAREFEEYDV